jgi:hypothetical protein
MEAMVAILPKGSWRQPALLRAVDESQIHTFGWPIGIVLNREPHAPHPTADGVQAEVIIDGSGPVSGGRTSYDYWNLRRTGDFYFLGSLFEDERADNRLFFDTRIVRTTELLLFLSRLYSRLEVPGDTRVSTTLTHGGLKNRELDSANTARRTIRQRITSEDQVTSTIECTVAELETQLVERVRALLEPLFVVFDFFELGDVIWSEIIDGFVVGQMK